MSLYFLLSGISPASIQLSLQNSYQSAFGEMQTQFRDTLKETVTAFNQNFEEVLLKFTGVASLFTPEEQLPLLLIATLSNINKTKDMAEISLRSVLTAVSSKDEDLSQKIFQMIFSEMYFYKDFKERQDQEVDLLPWQFQIKLIEYLIRFECSATQFPLNQKLVFHCFFSAFAQRLESVGLKFLCKLKTLRLNLFRAYD